MSPRGDYCGHLTWYKDVVIYELHVRTFHDSDGDGIGDFAGLTEKLDYLHDLGVTAIWLLPFNPSPLRDGRAAPLSAAGRRLRLPPPDGPRGRSAAEPPFPGLVDEAADRAAEALPRHWPGQARVPPPREPECPRLAFGAGKTRRSSFPAIKGSRFSKTIRTASAIWIFLKSAKADFSRPDGKVIACHASPELQTFLRTNCFQVGMGVWRGSLA